jgi:hypothetical protein
VAAPIACIRATAADAASADAIGPCTTQNHPALKFGYLVLSLVLIT